MNPDRKRTKSQEAAYAELMLNLLEQERWVDDLRRR